MKHTTKLLVLFAPVIGATVLAAAGWAYWSTSGTGTALAAVGTLNAPTSVVAGSTSGSTTVHVSWSSVSAPGGGAVGGYYVERFVGSTPSPACSSSLSSLLPGSSTSCDDNGVVDGTYTYRVTAAFRSWTAQSSPSDSVTVVGDATPPTVSSITKVDASPTNGGTADWTVTFSEPVTGVDTADFTLASTDFVSGASISSVTGSGATRTVTASTGTGDGTLGLNLVDDDTIADAAGNQLGGTGAGNGNKTGDVYSIDKTVPMVLNITRANSNPTNASTVSWTVTISESVSGVDTSDFALASAGISGASVSSVDGTFTVIANSGTGNGTLGLNLVDDDSIVDAAGNTLGGTGNGDGSKTGEVYALDKTGPTVTINQAAGQADPTNSGTVNFTVVFSEATTGFVDSDVTPGGTAGGTKSAAVTGGPTTYNVAVSGASGNGTVSATVNAGAIQDAAGNNSSASTSSDNTVTLDTTGPTVTNVTSNTVNGTYPAGTVIPVTVTFSEPVTVTGTPKLTLATGGAGTAVSYTGGTGTTMLTFNYTVAAGHTSADLDYASAAALALNGGTIRDAATNSASLALALPGTTGSLSDNKNIVIEATPPTAFAIDSAPASSGNGRPDSGDQIIYTYSEVMNPASIKTGWDGSSTTVTASFAHCSGNGSPDCLAITEAALGSVALQGSYVANGNKFFTASATMVMTTVSGKSVVTVSLTSSPSSNIATDTAVHQMQWTPSAAASDLAGNPAGTTPVTQIASKKNF
jgi:hypothetical protein